MIMHPSRFATGAAKDKILGQVDPAGLADLAVNALVDEALLTPKPGLVDQRGPGSHKDLDLWLMMASAEALHPTFVALARAAAGRPLSPALREQLGALGRAGEQEMLAVTGGSNSHRGAIWTIGLLLAGAVIDPVPKSLRSIARNAGRIARMPDRFAANTGYPGRSARHRFRVSGAPGEAMAGFPTIISCGLPALRIGQLHGMSARQRDLNVLVRLMSQLDDTCLLRRGGWSSLRRTQQAASRVLRAGGIGTSAGDRAWRELDRILAQDRLSPGGSADLLAGTFFLNALCATQRRTPQGTDEASSVPRIAGILPVQKADKLEAYPTLKSDRPEAGRATPHPGCNARFSDLLCAKYFHHGNAEV